MQNRATKTIRWILLAPVAIAVPSLVFSFIGGNMQASYNVHSLWYSILGMAPSAAAWFIPAFLTIPTACMVAPSHRKKISVIVLICAAFLWLVFWSALFSPPPDISVEMKESWRHGFVFHIIAVCAQVLGLLAGFMLVRYTLKKQKNGEPFLKRGAIVFTALICIAAVPLCLLGKGDPGIALGDLTWQENAGVVSYSFTLENKSDKPNAAAVELTVVRGHNPGPGESIYTAKTFAAAKASTEKTLVKIFLAPKEVKKYSGQFALDASATGTFILVPLLVDPNSPKTPD